MYGSGCVYFDVRVCVCACVRVCACVCALLTDGVKPLICITDEACETWTWPPLYNTHVLRLESTHEEGAKVSRIYMCVRVCGAPARVLVCVCVVGLPGPPEESQGAT